MTFAAESEHKETRRSQCIAAEEAGGESGFGRIPAGHYHFDGLGPVYVPMPGGRADDRLSAVTGRSSLNLAPDGAAEAAATGAFFPQEWWEV